MTTKCWMGSCLIFSLIWCGKVFGEDQLPLPPGGKVWKLIWNDEFEGTVLNDTKWAHRPEGSHRSGIWSDRAVSLDGVGHLKIAVFREGDSFVSGNVITKGKFEHAFGFFVARMQFQQQEGSWSAFWLTNDAVAKSGADGRKGTEIDIAEKFTWKDRIEHNLHWGGYGPEHQTTGTKLQIPGISHGWHTVGVWWSSTEYVFYVDGKETWRSKAGGVGQVPLYILLTNEIGPSAGDISRAALPDACLVAYVRVYDLVDKAGD